MRLLQQIALLVVLAAAVPLATAGFLLIRLNEEALEHEVKARFDETASHAAEAVAAEIDGKAKLVARTVETIPWANLSDAEIHGALGLLVNEVGGSKGALFEAGTPQPLVSWVAPNAQPLIPGSDPLAGRAPVARALVEHRGSVVLSAVYADGTRPCAAMAVPIAGGKGQRVAAIQLPLDGVASRLDAVRGGGDVRLIVVESDGKVVASSPHELAISADAASEPVVRDLLRGGPHAARRYVDSGKVILGAHAPVGDLGWGVIVEEEAAKALAAPRLMRRLTLLGSAGAGIAALAIALLFSRRLTKALERLIEGAQAMARGELQHRVGSTIGGADEVADLARTFDAMGARLAESRAEVEKWNRELEARVQARTAELREAQAQLVEAQKLAAVGQLGAGVAHEINNPLGAVLARVQLMLQKRPPGDPEREGLLRIEEQARRASQVVANLLTFSQRQPAAPLGSVDLNQVVRDTLSLTEEHIREKGLKLDVALDAQGPVVNGDARQLAQVLLNLVANARTATPSGGHIVVRTISVGEAGMAQLVVEDTGKGIAPEHMGRIFEPFFTTKDDWTNVGLGLSVSFRIVTDHGGRITVESVAGKGSTFTVHVPIASATPIKSGPISASKSGPISVTKSPPVKA